MKTNFVNDVGNLEAQARVAVENWRSRGASRAHLRHALSQSIVKSGAAPDEWREISRHIEIAVAEGQPYFALVELERVTDSLGRELRRGEPRILTTSEQAGEIVRAGYLRLDADRITCLCSVASRTLQVLSSRMSQSFSCHQPLVATLTGGAEYNFASQGRFDALV